MEETPEELAGDAARLHGVLQARDASLSTAESLTGGMLGEILTALPGASLTYRGGVIVYATDLKSELLGVPKSLLDERGPVDPEVAAAMAEGVRDRLGATWGVALTGVAGPDPQGDQPVGRVYIAVAGPAETSVLERQFPGYRTEIRMAACRDALHAVYDSVVAGE
jgi:nicotinamide-nucleotide amidase